MKWNNLIMVSICFSRRIFLGGGGGKDSYVFRIVGTSEVDGTSHTEASQDKPVFTLYVYYVIITQWKLQIRL